MGSLTRRKNFESSNAAGVFGSLTLSVVEISGDGDDGAVDGLAKVSFGPVSQFAQDESGNFRRGKHFVAEHHANDVFALRIDAERERA